MMTGTWIKIAVLNLLRNKRRSLFTILAIGMGYAAVNVFGGFTGYIFRNLQDSFIYAQVNGHMTIFKKGFLEEGQIDPTKYLITKDELEAVRKISAENPHILLTTPQMQIMGLVSNGEVTTIFIAKGRIPSDAYYIQSLASGMVGKLRFYEGKKLQDNIPSGIGVTFGLAKKLQLHMGSDVIVMGSTVDGRVNALDAQIFQMFDAPIEELSDKLMLLPLSFGQSLYDTDSMDRITLLLDKDENIASVKGYLERELREANLPLQIKTWTELSPFYIKVKKMFDILFDFIFIIVFVIVVTSVINTISMSVIERTREIGTLRALGLKRKGVMKLFAIESAMLAFLGCIFGLCLTTFTWLTINIFQPQWIPPNIPKEVPLEIYIIPFYLLISFLFLVILSALVAMLPARKASVKSIVDALGHA